MKFGVADYSGSSSVYTVDDVLYKIEKLDKK